MLKKLMMTTALSGLMMGAAFAQSAPPKPMDSPAAQPTPPAATKPLDAKPLDTKYQSMRSSPTR